VLGAGCASTPVATSTQVPPGTEVLLNNSYRLIEAFNQDDSKTWSEIRCLSSTNDAKVLGLASSKFFGKFSSPRLVAISSVSEAGNSTGQYKWRQVVIEVKATGYPVGNLLLKFVAEKSGCVGLFY
jgi:hypothetical protein